MRFKLPCILLALAVWPRLLAADAPSTAPAAAPAAPPVPMAPAASEVKTMTFNQPVSTYSFSLKELNPALPADWTGYDFLVLEFRASSSERFELGLQTATQLISKRIHPFPNVWVRAAIPLRFYRDGLGNGSDLAATVNQPRNSYWINIESGGHGPLTAVQGLSFVMRFPTGSPTLELRSVTLAKTDPGDDILEGKPIVDEFGQYHRVEWPGKAHSAADLKTAWDAEAAALAHDDTFPDRDQYGGFASTSAKATGFFRVEQINGVWWFVDPDGHLFYSTGVNAMVPFSGTRVAGREDYFAQIPPALPPPPGMPPQRTPLVSFYTANLQRRFGDDYLAGWANLTSERLGAWGLNTAYGANLNRALPPGGQKRAYVISLRGWQADPLIMGLPDVYADSFVQRVDAAAARQLTPVKDDPWLLGYFIGNEPPWPGRESQFVDLVLAGPPTAMQKRFAAALATGDSPEKRRALVLDAFAHYLDVINTAVKKYDPHHLNLGIRFGGTPPDYVVKLASGFDVYSLNKYRFEPPPATLDNVYKLTGRPVLIGEFHTGVPDRGLAPGLVQAMNQHERGLAYQYYVEHAAAHPQVIGTHWFEWIDEPVTGRADGENYNIGWIDVTDQPYADLVAAAELTHARLLAIHSGQLAPTTLRAQTSDVGTPDDAEQLGRKGVQ
jgi:hypothetical protein